MEQIKMAEFIEKHGLTMTATQIPVRTDKMMDEDPKHPMYHWLCTFSDKEKRTYALAFSCGAAHVEKIPFEKLGFYRGGMTRKDWEQLPAPHTRTSISIAQEQWQKSVFRPKPPTIDTVLDCIGSDCSSIVNSHNFEDWASDLGYETDSRKAERIYEAVMDQYRAVRTFLGHAALNTLMFEVERE